jgi:hypothetical protein
MASGPKKRGVFRDTANTAQGPEDRVADFSYENDALAQLIVDMWTGAHGSLISPAGPGTTPAQYKARSNSAKTVFAARGIYLAEPIVITETEYEDGFSLADAGLKQSEGVVFVLPRDKRATGASTAGGPPLLETAKMLMAITPNGI